MESHYPAVRTLAVRSYSSPHVLQYYGGSLLVVPSIHITAVPLILTLHPNPWASQISMIGGEYMVRTITGNEFDVIYTRSSATVKG